MKIGIDVSNHQGDIDWGKAAGEVDFVMIRAERRREIEYERFCESGGDPSREDYSPVTKEE